MPKDFTLNLEDTNCAKIGSPEDKEARKTAALTELTWEGCGQNVGVQIWRIEQFEVKAGATVEYGNFYDGDSYIILRTSRDEESDKLLYDIFFWLGLESTADEQGTAAYKTVELDDFFDGAAVQHREVMMHESKEFRALFPRIAYLKGGIDSGFNHVEAGAYAAKLLQVKKVGRQTNVIEVACARDSLNHGDCFILDAGASIYVWKGDECSPFEAQMANMAAEALESTRHGGSAVTHEIDDGFWAALGGEGAIVLPEPVEVGEGVLFQLSDADGSLGMSEVGRGDLTLGMLDTSDRSSCAIRPGSANLDRRRRLAKGVGRRDGHSHKVLEADAEAAHHAGHGAQGGVHSELPDLSGSVCLLSSMGVSADTLY